MTNKSIQPLYDRLKWNLCSIKEQDAIITHVATLLGTSFKKVSVRQYSCGPKHRIATFQHRPTEIDFNLIPGHQYTMGLSPRGNKREDELWKDCMPAHQVKIPPFLIGRFPVTQKQWGLVDSHKKWAQRQPNLPVTGVSWKEVKLWLKKTNSQIRLCSESEWEYACRAGTTTLYFWGEDMNKKYCWFQSNSREPKNVRLHEQFSNPFGLVDMLGNVWEWCEDTWDDNGYKRASNDQRAKEIPGKKLRVVRGGSWRDDHFITSALRGGMSDDFDFHDYVGFRAAMSLPLNTTR